MAFGWKTLGLLVSITAGVLSIAGGIIDDKKRSDEIKEEVRKEVAKQNSKES